MFDAPDLRKRREYDSDSKHILYVGKEPKKAADAPVTNAKLQDQAVRFPEARAQRNLKKMIVRSRITDEKFSRH